MSFAFGEIYFIKFDPSFDHEYQGTRPGMVIQEEIISKGSALVTVVPLTSSLNQLRAEDIFVEKDDLNRLMHNSVIKVRNIQSFDKKRFLSKLGRASSPVIRKMRGYLRRHFGL